MTVVKEAIALLNSFGLLDVLLPFIFTFTLVYAVFEKTKVLGPDKKNANIMVGFVIGFFVVAAFQVVQTLRLLIPWIALGLVFTTFVVFFALFLGAKELHKTRLPVALGFVGIGLLALYTLGLTGDIPWQFLEQVVLPTAIAIALFIGMMYLIMYEAKPEEPKAKPPEKPKGKFVPQPPEEIG